MEDGRAPMGARMRLHVCLHIRRICLLLLIGCG